MLANQSWSLALHELCMAPASCAFFGWLKEEYESMDGLVPVPDEALSQRKLLCQFLDLTIDSLQELRAALVSAQKRESSKPKLGGGR